LRSRAGAEFAARLLLDRYRVVLRRFPPGPAPFQTAKSPPSPSDQAFSVASRRAVSYSSLLLSPALRAGARNDPRARQVQGKPRPLAVAVLSPDVAPEPTGPGAGSDAGPSPAPSNRRSTEPSICRKASNSVAETSALARRSPARLLGRTPDG